MLAAIRRVECTAIDPRDGDDSNVSGDSAPPGWATIRGVYDAELRRWPEAPAHFALLRLLRSHLEAHQGVIEASKTATEAVESAAQDEDNLVTRLTWADLRDLAGRPEPPEGASPESGSSVGGPSALERFEAYREIVEGSTPPLRITLYNAEITRLWYEVLRTYIQYRPDVAVSLAPAVYHHYRVTDQYETLPILQWRLTALAEDLRTAGFPREAEACLGWFRQLCLGLMEADTDAGTRLLCADLLAKSLGDHPQAAAQLVKLRDDFHARAEAAPVNLADQSFVLRPAWAPEKYQAAMRWLLVAATFCLVGGGAAVVLVIASVIAIAARLFRHKRGEPRHEATRGWSIFITAPMAMIPSFAAAFLVLRHHHAHGVYSEAWGLATAVCIATIGGLASVAMAGLLIRTETAKQRRKAKLVGLILLCGFGWLAIPPASTAWILRYIDLAIPMLIVLCAVAVGAILLSLWWVPAQSRRITAVASMLWCMSSCTAFVVYQVHRYADKDYQRTVVSQGFDEVAARLGPDWKTTYLTPVREVLAENEAAPASQTP